MIYTNPSEQQASGLTRDRNPSASFTPPEPVYGPGRSGQDGRPAVRSTADASTTATQPRGPEPARVSRPQPVPEKSVVEAQPKAAAKPTSTTTAGAARVIEVKPRETLETLSHRFGVSISAILTANKLSTTSISPGQKLVIPNTEPTG